MERRDVPGISRFECWKERMSEVPGGRMDLATIIISDAPQWPATHSPKLTDWWDFTSLLGFADKITSTYEGLDSGEEI